MTAIARIPTSWHEIILVAEYGEAFDPREGEVVTAWFEYALEYRAARYQCGGHWLLPYDDAFEVDRFAADEDEGRRTIQFLCWRCVLPDHIRDPGPRPQRPFLSHLPRWQEQYNTAASAAQYFVWLQLYKHGSDFARACQVWWAVFEAGGPIVAVARTAREALALARHVRSLGDVAVPMDVPIYRLRDGAEPRRGRYYVARATSRLAYEFLQHRPGGGRYRYRLAEGKLDLVAQEEART